LNGPTGRLAPSPTGHLHVGHARTFLLAWWHVRSRGGRIVLRIEDLDGARARPELVDTCLRDLEWLGIDWDEKPLYQSADLAPYEEALERLVREGAAYACTCSRKEIEASLSAPHAGGELRYPGRCRGRYPSLQRAERSGSSPGLRLRCPRGPLFLEDGVVGSYATDAHAQVGDFLLARRDRTYAYQLAVSVDDARQAVDEVLRGDDLLSSTARQNHLQRALGLPHPRTFHVPLVVAPDGRRLAKRDRDLSLASLREGGIDPRRLVHWAARTSGQDAREELPAGALLEDFDLARLPRDPAVFGPGELSYFRGRAPLKESWRRPETRPSGALDSDPLGARFCAPLPR